MGCQSIDMLGVRVVSGCYVQDGNNDILGGMVDTSWDELSDKLGVRLANHWTNKRLAIRLRCRFME
jgi:hypothetical protein